MNYRVYQSFEQYQNCIYVNDENIIKYCFFLKEIMYIDEDYNKYEVWQKHVPYYDSFDHIFYSFFEKQNESSYLIANNEDEAYTKLEALIYKALNKLKTLESFA